MDKVVVYASDGNDLEFLKASIFSLKKNIEGDVKIYVLSSDLVEEEIQEATLIDPSDVLDSIGFYSARWNRKWPYATLFRMVIPLYEEFRKYDKVLYLDTDTLVVSKDINKLFDIDPQNNEIIASQDSFGTYKRIIKCIYSDLKEEASDETLKRIWKNRKIEGTIYVNAGVNIWCVKNIVKNGLDWYIKRLKWFWEAETRSKFDYLDQDFVNSMMLTSSILPRRFNTYINKNISNIQDIVIKHFISSSKPKFLPTAIDLGYKKYVPQKKNAVLYASDGRDIERLKFSIASVKKFLAPYYDIYILAQEKNFDKFDIEDVTLIDPLKILEDIGFNPEEWNRKWPIECLFRLTAPFLDTFNNIDKILYLDTDTLIQSRKALRLFNINPNVHEFYGVPDIEAKQNTAEDLCRQLGRKVYDEINTQMNNLSIKKCRAYINSGVLLICLNAIRNNGIQWYKKRLEYCCEAYKRGSLHYIDQDSINAVMDVSASISVNYNKFCSDRGFHRDCVIQHFVGGTKRFIKDAVKEFKIQNET